MRPDSQVGRPDGRAARVTKVAGAAKAAGTAKAAGQARAAGLANVAGEAGRPGAWPALVQFHTSSKPVPNQFQTSSKPSSKHPSNVCSVCSLAAHARN